MKQCEACQLEVVESTDTLVRAVSTVAGAGTSAAFFHPKCWRRAAQSGWRLLDPEG